MKNSVINIAAYIDHTILKPVTTRIDIIKICDEAATYGFAAVCIPPPFVSLARTLLSNVQDVKAATVIGFPFGYSTAWAKLAEAEQALADGAEELDIVINLIALKNGDWDYLLEEIALLVRMIHGAGKVIKVIIESGILEEQEIIRCCEIYGALGIDYMKTSTGYAETGATVRAVQLMREHLPPTVRIKASGGIRTFAFARELIGAGADRLGCSASVAIVQGANAPGDSNY